MVCVARFLVVLPIACFIARRNVTRFSSCSAMFSATSCASSSGLFTSSMFTATFCAVIFCSSAFSASMDAPFLPITIPGFAVYTLIFTLPAVLSIVILEMPASYSLFLMNFLILTSSTRLSAKSFSAYHFASQSLMIPTLKP